MELKPVLLGAVAESRAGVEALTGSATCASACDWTSDYMKGCAEVEQARTETETASE